jgi:uncharacterized protein (DUF1810 family)
VVVIETPFAPAFRGLQRLRDGKGSFVKGRMEKTGMAEEFDLERFVEAQASVYPRVVAELKRGRKESHWMWFIFPQVSGLGMSAMAQLYAISSLAEARAYLDHKLLGARLRECTDIVNGHQDSSADAIFGYPDTLKFRSSMTLFTEAAEGEECFRRAIETFFGGEGDKNTIELLGRSRGGRDFGP